MTSLVPLIPLFPLISFLILGILNKKLSKGAAGTLACAAVLGSFVVSVLTFLQQTKTTAGATVSLFQWFQAGSLKIDFAFWIDPLSCLFLLIITGVGFLIHVYSLGYMHEDEGHNRFFAYLNLFIFFMLLLVLGNNFLVMFVGWEGVGLCSYLLIGFWFKNPAYNDAAKKAFVMNRIGDLGFLLSIFLIFVNFGSLNFIDIFSRISSVPVHTLNLIALLLFVGAMGKSAQLPLYTWLPDAMAGPTPVSALIHAATMVTAGIYMVARSNAIYVAAPDALEVVSIIGIATALFAATIGLFQNDIKKVLAYSTVSQLGYMFLGLGVGAFTGAVFHVMTHAFFKALLFLGAGSVIHAMSGEQDIRNMGGLKKHLPVTHLTFFLGTLAIAGLPPFAGFFSKDEILSHVFEHSKILWALGVAGSVMTCFYMFRLYFLTFHGSFRGSDKQKHHLHESPKSMTVPLIVLAFLSVTGGFLGIPHVIGNFLGHAPHLLGEFLAPVFVSVSGEGHEPSASMEMMLMGITLALLVVTIFIAHQIFIAKNKVPAKDSQEVSWLQQLIYQKYYVDELYDAFFVKPLFEFSKKAYSFFEVRFLDGIVNGFGKAAVAAGTVLRVSQSGNLGLYVFIMVLAAIAMLSYKLL